MGRIYHRESVDLGGTRRIATPATRSVVVVQDAPVGPAAALEDVPVDELAAAEANTTQPLPLPRRPAPPRRRVDA